VSSHPATPATRLIRLVLELRQSGITDATVLGAIERVPRERFVPPTFRHQAYENVAVPIGHGQTLSQPLVVARMTEALALGDRHKVLEIGTGSGYHTAVLARLSRRVYTIERHRPLTVSAENALRELRIHNVTARVGDGMLGWPEQAPFDRIVVAAAAAEPPPALLEQLALGGIMVLPIGTQERSQMLYRVERTAEGFVGAELAEVRFVPLLPGAGAELTG